jgi:hypothetical protein
MSANPEHINSNSDAKEAVPVPEPGGVAKKAKKVKYVGPPVANGSPPGLAVKGEVARGVIGILAGVGVMIWGGFMIHDGIHGEVAFTLHFGEHNSLDVKTAVVGIVVMLIGLGLALFTAIKVDWTTTPEKQKPAADTRAEGA